jgi:hypothetical protein
MRASVLPAVLACLITGLIGFCNAATQVVVNSNADLSSDWAGCAPATPGTCTLRNAVSFCLSFSAVDCDVAIPERLDIVISDVLGAIVVKTSKSVRMSISGNGSSLSPAVARKIQLFRFDGTGSSSFSVRVSDLDVSGFGLAAATGGAVFVSNVKSFALHGVRVGSSYAELGGALYVSHSTGLLVYNCSFSGNTATGNGGALFINMGVTVRCL